MTVSGLNSDVTLYHLTDILRNLHESLMPPTKFVSVRELLEKPLNKLLPEDAHKLCSGRLGVTLTKAWSLESKFISEYETRQELLDAVVAGSFIPVWSGHFNPPLYKGEPHMDGGFTNNKPAFKLTREEELSGRRQIFVSAFTCDLDVCPEIDDWWFTFNNCDINYKIHPRAVIRGCHALIPVAIPSYKVYLVEGHSDMKKYVLQNKMVKCRDCFERGRKESVIKDNGQTCIPNTNENEDVEEPCLSCLLLIEKVENLKIPDEILKMMK